MDKNTDHPNPGSLPFVSPGYENRYINARTQLVLLASHRSPARHRPVTVRQRSRWVANSMQIGRCVVKRLNGNLGGIFRFWGRKRPNCRYQQADASPGSLLTAFAGVQPAFGAQPSRTQAWPIVYGTTGGTQGVAVAATCE